MKFINLIKRETSSPYDSIILHGCGPNFVNNRRESFASMIKEQGVTFWFRFWLNFCFNPGCPYLRKVYRNWPGFKNYLNIQIHRQFLEGSVEDAVKYCLDKAIMFLRSTGRKPAHKKRSVKGILADLQDFTEMAFGAALCEVFCIWLKASDMTDKSRSYWQLPSHYLYLHFEPGRLEKFLVKQWDDFLLLLFDVNLKDIPWFLKVLYASPYDNNVNDNSEVMRQCTDPNFQSTVEYMRNLRDQRLLKIQVIDEIPIPEANFIVHGLNEDKPNPASEMLKEMIQSEPLKSYNQYQCAYCSNIIDVTSFPKFRLCKRCVEENCVEPRYYCNASCQIEHWFLQHHNEHCEMVNDDKYYHPCIYVKDSVNSFPFCKMINPDKPVENTLEDQSTEETKENEESAYSCLNSDFDKKPIMKSISESKELQERIENPHDALRINSKEETADHKETSNPQEITLTINPTPKETQKPPLSSEENLKISLDRKLISDIATVFNECANSQIGEETSECDTQEQNPTSSDTQTPNPYSDCNHAHLLIPEFCVPIPQTPTVFQIPIPSPLSSPEIQDSYPEYSKQQTFDLVSAEASVQMSDPGKPPIPKSNPNPDQSKSVLKKCILTSVPGKPLLIKSFTCLNPPKAPKPKIVTICL